MNSGLLISLFPFPGRSPTFSSVCANERESERTHLVLHAQCVWVRFHVLNVGVDGCFFFMCVCVCLGCVLCGLKA